MDQSKTNVPLFSRRTSDKTVGHRLVGVTVPGGTNLMVEILRQTLLKLQEQGKLPHNDPVLYLQMDNCSENKNKTLFAFLADLVLKNVFNEVHVGFLMVGHTHEDIDQFFSIISSWLRKVQMICPDPQSLSEAIKDAFWQRKGGDIPEVIIYKSYSIRTSFRLRQILCRICKQNLALLLTATPIPL